MVTSTIFIRAGNQREDYGHDRSSYGDNPLSYRGGGDATAAGRISGRDQPIERTPDSGRDALPPAAAVHVHCVRIMAL
jgi:hypothetical protein